jgi:hypothetical protein
MIYLKCSNPKCEVGKFLWDESSHLIKNGGIAKPWEPDVASILVKCPDCGTDNKIWLKGLKKEDQVPRGI